MRQEIELGANCPAQRLLQKAWNMIVGGISGSLSPNPQSKVIIADLGCARGELMELLVRSLEFSKLGENWRKKISLIGIDNDQTASESFNSRLAGKAEFRNADITKEIPLNDASCSFLLISQMDTVFSQDNFKTIVSLAKKKLVRGGYLGVLMVHPAYAKTFVRSQVVRLKETDSIEIELAGKKRWYHGRSVFPIIFNDLNFDLVGQVDLKTDMPMFQYNLFANLR